MSELSLWRTICGLELGAGITCSYFPCCTLSPFLITFGYLVVNSGICSSFACSLTPHPPIHPPISFWTIIQSTNTSSHTACMLCSTEHTQKDSGLNWMWKQLDLLLSLLRYVLVGWSSNCPVWHLLYVMNFLKLINKKLKIKYPWALSFLLFSLCL